MTKAIEKNLPLFIVGVLTLLTLVCLDPSLAFASSTSDTSNTVVAGVFASITNILKILLSYVFLPIGIAFVAGKIVYLALVCGVVGKDPLGITGKDSTPDPATVNVRIKEEFKNTLYGLLWVGGIWLLFRILLEIAIFLTTAISNNMSAIAGG